MTRMKNKYAIIFSLLAPMAFSAAPLFAQDLLIPRSGDYVFYYDTRESTDRLIGYLQPSEDTLFVRVYDFTSGKDLVVAYKHSGFRQGFAVTEVKAVQGDVTQAIINKLYSEANFILKQRLAINEKEFPRPIVQLYKEESMNYSILLDFQYWIPIFQLREIRTDSKNMGTYRIVKTGLMKSTDDTSFFDFKGLPTDQQTIRYAIPVRKMKDISHYNVSLSVYDDWQYRKVEEKWPSYWVSIMSGRDAILLLEPLDLASRKISDPYFFIKYFVLLGNEKILSDSVSIREDVGYIEVAYITHNSETKMSTLQISRLFEPAEGQYTVVTLSAYEPLYRSNWDYFQRIWQSIKILH